MALKIIVSLFLVLQIYNAEPQDELMPQAATIDAIDGLMYVFYYQYNIFFSLNIRVVLCKKSYVLVGSGRWEAEHRCF